MRKDIINLIKHVRKTYIQELKNSILHQLKQPSVLIQAQHTVISYLTGSRDMTYPHPPKDDRILCKGLCDYWVQSRLCHKNTPVLVANPHLYYMESKCYEPNDVQEESSSKDLTYRIFDRSAFKKYCKGIIADCSEVGSSLPFMLLVPYFDNTLFENLKFSLYVASYLCTIKFCFLYYFIYLNTESENLLWSFDSITCIPGTFFPFLKSMGKGKQQFKKYQAESPKHFFKRQN